MNSSHTAMKVKIMKCIHGRDVMIQQVSIQQELF